MPSNAVTTSPHRASVLQKVANERARQTRLFGEQSHTPYEWLAILMEEVGEVANAVLYWQEHGEYSLTIEQEMVQVAAVAVAAIEDFGRRNEQVRFDMDLDDSRRSS